MEKQDERKLALRMQKNLTEWRCNVCSNGQNYTIAGKHMHLKTKKHQRNVNITNDFLKLKNEISNDDFFKIKT